MIRRIAATLVALVLSLPASANIEIEEITSPGGIDAWLVEDPSIPFVTDGDQGRGELGQRSPSLKLPETGSVR